MGRGDRTPARIGRRAMTIKKERSAFCEIEAMEYALACVEASSG
jgi:hypothetical protein